MKMSYAWAMPNKWTFKMKPIQKFIGDEVFKHKVVLIPFGGMQRWGLHQGIIYIDIEAKRPQPYIRGDCREVMQEMIDAGIIVDCIISDPPFSFHQAVHSYNNIKMQDLTYCKNLYDQLLKPGGIIIHCGFNSTGMGKSRGYIKEELLIVNCGGSHNDFLILKEVKKNLF